MGCYQLHDLILDVQPADLEARADLVRLWSEFSWDPVAVSPDTRAHHIALRLHEQPFAVPEAARRVFTTDSFSGFEQGDDFYLSDGGSVFHFQQERRGDAYLAPSFFVKPRPLQDLFWSFGLARLLRTSHLYCLHAAGLVAPGGEGVLVVGASGSGKTTLALASIRRGWRYLSDDAVLLRRARPSGDCEDGSAEAISALGLRAHLYIDAQAAPIHEDLALGGEVPDVAGGRRCRVYLDAARAGKRVRACVPRLLVFPRITGLERSDLRALDAATAVKLLLAASGPQLWDARTMRSHLTALTDLVRQAPAYELHAGLDTYRSPSALLEQLETMTLGPDTCHASSSN